MPVEKERKKRKEKRRGEGVKRKDKKKKEWSGNAIVFTKESVKKVIVRMRSFCFYPPF